MKLTSKLLRKIIEEEVQGFGDAEDVEKKADETEEVDADELAGTLEKDIDYMKALKIEEARTVRRLKKIQEAKRRTLNKLYKKI